MKTESTNFYKRAKIAFLVCVIGLFLCSLVWANLTITMVENNRSHLDDSRLRILELQREVNHLQDDVNRLRDEVSFVRYQIDEKYLNTQK